MRPKVKEINLLPKEHIQAQKMKVYIFLGVLILLLECVLFAVTVVLPPMREIKQQESLLLDLEIQANDPKFLEVNQTMENLNRSKEEVQKWIDKYKALKKPSFVNGELLTELVARLPQGVTIDNLDVKTATPNEGEAATEGSSIIIKGRIQTARGLLHYITLLETIYKDTVVTFKIEEGTAESTYQKYEITIKMPVSLTKETDEKSPETIEQGEEQTVEESAEGGNES
ncbi:MAG: hypothetical protein K0S71_1439 [Clostridia bacterium]|jgi:Tfp pilus assembly protein PilN|nr:hypothetical protein [Clostridia bacterium]